jgi:hypothetical protein
MPLWRLVGLPTEESHPSVPCSGAEGLFAVSVGDFDLTKETVEDDVMYPAVPAEALTGAFQGLTYLMTAIAVFFGWVLMPR